MTASDIDHIINHLSLKKSRRRWRNLAITALLALVAAVAIATGFEKPLPRHVARLEVTGLITGDERQLELIRDLAIEDKVVAMIVRINSPGGTTVGSEALYEELRKFGAKKPVVAVMDSVAASGGYITALAADRIFARQNTITGSIGVIFSYPDVTQLLGTVGVKMEEVKSGPLKAEPSGTKPTSPETKAVIQAMVDDGFRWFKGLVAERRKLDAATVDRLSDGRVYTGRQALSEKLIDEVGAEEDVRLWLEGERDIALDLETITRSLPAPEKTGLDLLFGKATAKIFGFDIFAKTVQASKLDGLLVLWHPSL